VQLVVEDNGAGIAAGSKLSSGKKGRGIGLLGMRERLDLFRGGLEIEKGRSGGLRLSAHLPLRARP
jgi:signal transduction histidine kinase